LIAEGVAPALVGGGQRRRRRWSEMKQATPEAA